MRETLRVLNDLERNGLYSRYAIGGAVAAIFYSEPVDTEDLDIFVHLQQDAHPLMPMKSLYDELLLRRYSMDGIYHVIEGIPVQFLPDSPALVEEAVEEAITIEFEGVTTRIPTAEHLLAIMVHTGRLKDRVRAVQMREQAALDDAILYNILEGYQLVEKYETWKQPL